MKILKAIFNYFKPVWSGNDGRPSLRCLLAIAFSSDFIKNLSHCIFKWDAGRSLADLSMIMGIEAGLIVALLGLTTYQNMMFGKLGSVLENSDKEKQSVDNPDK